MQGGRLAPVSRTTPEIPRVYRYSRKAGRMTTKTVQYDILDGPSNEMLIDAFKHAFSKNVSVEVIFVLAPSNSSLRKKLGHRKVKATVTGLRYESGMSGRYIIWMNTGLPHHTQIEGGYYNTDDRKGCLKFEVQTDRISRVGAV